MSVSCEATRTALNRDDGEPKVTKMLKYKLQRQTNIVENNAKLSDLSFLKLSTKLRGDLA